MLKEDGEVDIIPKFDLKRFQVYKTSEDDLRTVPKTIKMDKAILSLDFHPLQDLLTFSVIDGNVFVYDYSNLNVSKLKFNLKNLHNGSCNCCQFSDDGNSILSVSSDKNIIRFCLKSEKIIWKNQNSHENGIETCLQCEDKIFSTGDSNGVIKIWDLRQKKEIYCFSEHTDSISKFDYNEDRSILYSVSLDGRLSVLNLKQQKIVSISSPTYSSASYIDVKEVNYGKTIVCATDDGCLDMYFYGRFSSPANRLKKHEKTKIKPSFECLCFLKDNLLAASHSNGYIGLYDVSRSDKILHKGGIGRYNTIRISVICLTSDGKFIGSVNDENKINFWHTEHLFRKENQNWWETDNYFENEIKNRKRKREEDEYEIEIEKQVKKKTKINSKPKKFFADMTK